MKDENPTEEHQTPGWLKTIQLNSWEAELLISALVLYALFQVPDYIREFQFTNFERDSIFHRFFTILKRAVQLLSFGYVTHILVRGYWVANVGLSYVFPKGIDKKRLAFKGKFGKELQHQGSIVKGVLRLEELSSMIYGISFLLFGCLLGFGTLFLPFLILSQSVASLIAEQSSLAVFAGFGVLIYIILFFILFIDFVTNGLFRRIDWTAKIYYPVAFVCRILTLSFLYRRALLVLVSNVKGWKAYLIPVILFVVSYSFLQINGKIWEHRRERYLDANHLGSVVPSNYENKRRSNEFYITAIQSDLVSESVLSVFLSDLSLFDRLYSRDININVRWPSLTSDETGKLLNDWITFSIDSSKQYTPDWFITQHPTDLNYGFSTFIDINELDRGLHSLKVSLDTTGMDSFQKRLVRTSEYHNLTLSNIQFFYNPTE